MKLQSIVLFLLMVIVIGCKEDSWNLNKIEGKQIPITDSLKTNPEFDNFIEPYRKHVNESLDSVLAYSVATYSKTDGELNTAIGNLFADIILEQANPVFKSRTGKNIDMVLVNHGGIRSVIPKGNVTIRTAYEIMPFENSIVVVSLNGKSVNKLIDYLVEADRAHPISGLKLSVNSNKTLNEALINGSTIDTTKTYFVATNDYLYNGGDHMTFFQPNEGLEVLNYKIRNALLDYFEKTDTISPVIDDRFIKLKN